MQWPPAAAGSLPLEAVLRADPAALPPADAGKLLTLQRAAFATEAQLYGDPWLPALVQTLAERAEGRRPVRAWRP